MKSVKQQIAELQCRTDAVLQVSKFHHQVQIAQLARAEKLRKLVVALCESRKPDFTVGFTCRADVSATAMNKLARYAEALRAFHIRKPIPAAVKKILKGAAK